MENKNNFVIKVEIWSDVVCPFCYIGKHKFEKALEKFPYRENVQVEWKSFQLDPFAVTNPELKTMEHLAAEKGWSMEQALQPLPSLHRWLRKSDWNFILKRQL